MIVQSCIACGHAANVDMRHKLTTFILKNPPDQVRNKIVMDFFSSKFALTVQNILANNKIECD